MAGWRRGVNKTAVGTSSLAGRWAERQGTVIFYEGWMAGGCGRVKF